MSFLIASVGYPVWSSGGGKDLSQPFPCMHRHCGCRNAEQCWRGCCCFTNQQKLTWAKTNKVTPPEYVVAAARAEAGQEAKSSCCSKQKSNGCHAVVATPSDEPLTAVVEPMTCLGQLEHWVALGAIDLPCPDTWQLELQLHGDVVACSCRYSFEATAPVPPPPWL